MMSAYSLPTNRQAGTRLRAPGGRGLSARAGYTCLRVLAGTSLLFLSACGGGKTPAAPSVPNQVPAFTAPPSDTTVVAGAVATFTAAASGHPDPTFHWERSGLGGWSAVSGATGKTFTFTAQAVDNGATFRAVATNSQGTATSKVATLSVNAPPTISAAPADRTVSAGDLLSFTVTATANGSLSYQWRKSGTALPGATDATLSLSNLTPADSGVYDVEVTSTLKQTKVAAIGHQVTVNVVALPAASLAASPAQPRFGETASLLPTLKNAVRATLGTSPGGSEIAASVSDGVAIPTLATTGSQTYYLRAFNAAGSYADATLNVAHQTVQIGSILPALSTLAVGGQTTFSASVTGGLKGTVRWSASSGTLDTATGQWTAPTVPESCVITATSEDDATQTKALMVLVVPGPATRLGVSFPTSVVLGESATATITALDAYDNIATAFAGQVSFSSSDTFALLPTPQNLPQGVGSFPVTLKSSGTQSLTTTSGTLSTSLSGITVQYTAPTFSVQPADLSADPNIPISLPATATGLPAPEITWESSRDGITWIAMSGSASNPVAGGTASTLAFTPQLSDSGLQYRATARSLDGGTFRTATSSVARLTVAHGKVYIGGYRTLSSVKHAGYWRDKTWVSLPELSPANDSQVNVVVLTATDVYAGGYCRNSENLMIPGYWKNGQWIGLVPGNGADTQIKYMSVKEEDAITTIGVVGIPDGGGATATGNWFWINGVRHTFSGFPYVSFQPKGIEADQDGFGIPMAAIDAAGKTVTCAYMEFMGDQSWVISDMPPDYYSITSYAHYQGTLIFAGNLRSAGGQTAGYGYLNQPAWQKMAPDSVGPSNRGFVRSVADHGGNLYAYVYANNIPAQFWVNGAWHQVYQPTSDYAPNGPLFANPDGYYQAGTAGYRAGYWKNNVWTYVGTLADGTTPTCIAAR